MRRSLVRLTLVAAACLAATASRATPSDTSPSPSGVASIDLNGASEEEIAALPWVGPLLAEAIERERRLHGPFRSPEDLRRVDGLDDGALAALAGTIPPAPGEQAVVETTWRFRPERTADVRNGSATLTVRSPDGRRLVARVALARRSGPAPIALTAAGSGLHLEAWRGPARRAGSSTTRAPSASAAAHWVAAPSAALTDGARVVRETRFGAVAGWCGRQDGQDAAVGRALAWGVGVDLRPARDTRAGLGLRREAARTLLVGEAAHALRLFAGEATVGVRAEPSLVALAAVRSGAPERGWDFAFDLGWPAWRLGRAETRRAPWLRVRAARDRPQGGLLSATFLLTQQDAPGALAARARWRLTAQAVVPNRAAPRGGAPLVEAAVTASARDAIDEDDHASRSASVSAFPGRLALGAAVATRGAGAWSLGWSTPLGGASGWRLGAVARHAAARSRAPLPTALADLRLLAPAGAGVDLSAGCRVRVAAVALDAVGVVTAERGGTLRLRAVVRAATGRKAVL